MKKILSMILVLALMMSFSVVAFAEGEEVKNPTITINNETPADDPAVPSSLPVKEGVDVSGMYNDNGVVDTVQEAVDVAESGSTIEVTESGSTGGAVLNGNDQNLTIALGGNTLDVDKPSVGSNGTETLGMQLKEESESVTIEDGTINFTGDTHKVGIQNYTDLTLDGVTVTIDDNFENYAEYVASFNNGDVLLTGGTAIIAKDGQVAFDVFDYASGGYDGVTVTVEGEDTTITGTIEVGGTAKEGEEDATLIINNGTFNQFALYIQNGYESGVNVNGGKYKFNSGAADRDGYTTVNSADTLKLYIPKNHEIVQSGGYWVVQLIVVNEVTGEATQVAVPVPVVTGGVAETEYVEVEVNGETVHFWIDSGYTRTEDVAPVVMGKGEDVVMGIFVEPTSFAMSMDKVIEAYEALVPSAVVSVKGGDVIDAADYEFEFSEDGMINIKLAPEVLEALGAGTHTIIVEFAGMYVEFYVTVV